ncbi:MAG TPA: hypothetical protein VGK54_05850 [Chloroflexota bacterium]
MSEAQLWLALPLILRVLGDENTEQLLDRAQSLLSQDPDLLQRLVAVSARLELIDRLRVERIVQGQEVYADREWQEVDQLCAYLAATCIPIAHPAPPTRDGFSGLIAALPTWAQDWLADCYVLLQGGIDQTPIERWQRLQVGTRARRIGQYFAWMADRYPRQVDFEPWDWHDRAHLPPALLDAAYEFVSLHEDGDLGRPVEITVGVRKGLAEVEIVRFLLVLSLRAQLDLESPLAFLDSYWGWRTFRTSGLQTLRELEANLAHLNRWSSQPLHPRSARADFSLLAGLAHQAATQLTAQVQAATQHHGLDESCLNDYVAAVGRINDQIDEFNLRCADPVELDGKAQAETALFSTIVADPGTADLVARMETLHRDLNRVLDSPG